MRIFLCGGGCGQQTVDANKKLNKVIDHNKPILYIPLAMPSERYPSCYEWIKDELKGVDVPNIGQHRTIAEASAVESPIRQETIGFPAHFFARAHNFKPPGRACQPEADSPMRT